MKDFSRLQKLRAEVALLDEKLAQARLSVEKEEQHKENIGCLNVQDNRERAASSRPARLVLPLSPSEFREVQRKREERRRYREANSRGKECSIRNENNCANLFESTGIFGALDAIADMKRQIASKKNWKLFKEPQKSSSAVWFEWQSQEKRKERELTTIYVSRENIYPLLTFLMACRLEANHGNILLRCLGCKSRHRIASYYAPSFDSNFRLLSKLGRRIRKEGSGSQFESMVNVVKPVAKGKFSRVYACERRLSKKISIHAVKVFQKDNNGMLSSAQMNAKNDALKRMRSEISILRRIWRDCDGETRWDKKAKRHLLCFNCVYETPSYLFLVSPGQSITQGDLYSRLTVGQVRGGAPRRRVPGAHRLPEPHAARILNGILLAVNYLHEKGIVHRDIKPENILCRGNKLDEIVLADFGFAAWKKDADTKFYDILGSIGFIAPEVLISNRELNRGYDEKADLWSIGVVLYLCLFGGRMPFQGTSDREVVLKSLNCEPKFRVKGVKISHGAKQLLSKLLEKNPDKRISAKDALHNQWLVQNRKEK